MSNHRKMKVTIVFETNMPRAEIPPIQVVKSLIEEGRASKFCSAEAKTKSYISSCEILETLNLDGYDL